MWIQAADSLGPVKRLSVGAISDLMSATESASHNGSPFGTVAKGREETLAADLHRKVVVFFLVSEGSSHAAASGVDLLNGHSRDSIEKAFHGGGAKECFLVAVAVDEDAGEGGTEAAVEVALLDLAIEEFINHHDVFFYALAELFVVDEVGQVIYQGGAAAGFADDNL